MISNVTRIYQLVRCRESYWYAGMMRMCHWSVKRVAAEKKVDESKTWVILRSSWFQVFRYLIGQLLWNILSLNFPRYSICETISTRRIYSSTCGGHDFIKCPRWFSKTRSGHRHRLRSNAVVELHLVITNKPELITN